MKECVACGKKKIRCGDMPLMCDDCNREWRTNGQKICVKDRHGRDYVGPMTSTDFMNLRRMEREIKQPNPSLTSRNLQGIIDNMVEASIKRAKEREMIEKYRKAR